VIEAIPEEDEGPKPSRFKDLFNLEAPPKNEEKKNTPEFDRNSFRDQ
jgi:hypothetical protein